MPLGVNFRSSSTYVTDPTGFVAQTDFTLYSPSRGYGYLAISSGSNGRRNRTTALDPQLAGLHFSNAGFKFRIDLPNGPGRYRLRAVHCDSSSDNPTGFRYWDGQGGQELAYVAGHTYNDSYQTILGNHPAKAQFSQTKEDYVEHVFESDHIVVERDVYLDSGLGIISSVWVQQMFGLGDEKFWLCPTISASNKDLAAFASAPVLNGGMTVASDGQNAAYSFDGSNDYISVANNAEISISNPSGITLSAWVRPDTVAGGDTFSTSNPRNIFWKGNTTSDINYCLRILGSKLSFVYRNSAGNAYHELIESSGSVVANAWQHVVLSGDSSGYNLYVNGSQVSSSASGASASDTPQTNTHNLYIGTQGNESTRWFDGLLDDARIFDRKLSAAEISHLAKGRGVLGSPAAVGLGGESLWVCPSISDSKDDISGHNITTTLNNSASIVSDATNGGSKAFDFGGSSSSTQTNNFDSGFGDWSTVGYGGGVGSDTTRATTQSHSGTHSIRMVNANETADRTGIAQTLTIGSGGGTVSGYYYCTRSGHNNDLNLELWIDGSYVSEFTPSSTQSWVQFSFNLSAGGQTVALVRYQDEDAASGHVHIDSISVTNVVVSDYVSTNMQGELDFFQRKGVWSVAAWVKCDDGASTASQGLVGTSLDDTGYGFNLWMSSSTSEGLRGDVPKNTSNQYITNVNEGSAWPDSNWHHIAFVSDGTTATLYRDGTSIATQALGSLATANQQETTNALLFGASPSSGSAAGGLDGRMDDIRIFRRPITQSEITRLASKRGILGPALPEGLGDEGIWLAPTITGNNANIAKPMLAPTKYNGNAEVVASTGSQGSKAFEVGGGSERVNIDEVLSFQKDYPCTLSFWLKADSVSNSQRILGKRAATGNEVGWNLEISGNVLEMDAMSQSGWPYRLKVTASNLLTAATWHHLVITWDGSDANGWQLWVDGVKKTWTVDGNNGNNFPSSSNMRTSADFVFGGRGTSTSNSYVGQFDDIRVYRRIIEAAEISHLSASRGVSGKPKSYKAVINESVTYSTLQKQSTTQYCTQTNIVGTLSDTNATGRFVEGPTKNLSNAIKFNSSYSRRIAFASVPSGLAGMTKYTVCAWVKAQVSSTAQRTVVGWDNNTTATSYSLRTHNGTSAKGPDLYHAGSAIIQRNTQDNANAWQHIAVQVDTTTGETKSYINGQLDASATGGSYSAVNGTLASFGIGATFNGSVANYHDAAIAGVGIWDKILTPQEINALYSEYKEELVGLRTEKLWIVPTRTKDRSNVMYPATANTELSGSLSIVDDVSDGGTKAIQFDDSDVGNYLEWDDNTDSDPVTVSFWLEGSGLYNANDIPALIGKSASSALRLYTDPGDVMSSGQTLGFSADSNWHTGNSWADSSYGGGMGGGGTIEWHHVAIVRDYQTNTKFYVDGSLVHTGSADDTTAGAWTAASYFIGVDKSTGVEDNNFLGKLDDFRVIDGAATASEIAHLAKYRGILGGPYIECDAGEFNVTGNDAGFASGTAVIPVSMSADVATFTLTGQAATFKENVNLSASAGSFTLTGQTAGLTQQIKMTAGVGSFALTGIAAELTQQVKMSAGVGSFALSGQAADLVYAQKIAAGTGAFSLTGVNASLVAATNLTAGVGSFTLTGNATDGLDIKLGVQSGSFTLTGNSAALQTSTSQQLPADTGSFAVTPQNTTVLAVEINQTAGAFAVTGVAAPLDTKIVTSAASFTVAGQSAFLGLTFELAVGTFQVSGTSLPPIPGTQRPTPYYYRLLMQDE